MISLKYIGLSAGVVILASCASSPPPVSTIAETATLASVKSGDGGLVIMDVSGQRCETTNFTLENVNTSEKHAVKIVQKRRGSSSLLGISLGEPALVSLPAGTYQLASGGCYNHGFQPINYTWLDRWFEPFEVKNGDVSYLGSLAVSAAKGTGKRTTTNEVATFVLGLGSNKVKPTQYPVYQFLKLQSRASAVLNQNYPELAKDLKYVPPKARLTPKEFRNVVEDAFKPDADGEKPLIKDAAQQVRDYMEGYKS